MGSKRVWQVLAAGMGALILAMGIGRFAYTPLLPGMRQATGMDSDLAGLLASINYVDYLAGALAAAAVRARWKEAALRASLAVSVATTLAMAASDSFVWWGAMRLLSGLASAFILVLATDVAVRALQRAGRPALASLHFSGVALGIVLTGTVASALGAESWRPGWIILGAIAAALLPVCWLWLRTPADDAMARPPAPPDGKPAFPIAYLTAAYFCEGAGYIVTGTFLVDLAKSTPGLSALAENLWIVVGLAGIPSVLFWSRVGVRIGLPAALVLAHVVQAFGIALPALTDSSFGALAASVLYGGTFLGITALAMVLGARSGGSSPSRVVGLLTAGFGIGQIVGPIAAGVLAAGGRGFAPALLGAAGIVLFGAVLLLAGALQRRP